MHEYKHVETILGYGNKIEQTISNERICPVLIHKKTVFVKWNIIVYPVNDAGIILIKQVS